MSTHSGLKDKNNEAPKILWHPYIQYHTRKPRQWAVQFLGFNILLVLMPATFIFVAIASPASLLYLTPASVPSFDTVVRWLFLVDIDVVVKPCLTY
jgi:hypothetical protein